MRQIKEQLKNLGKAIELDKNASKEMRAMLLSKIEGDMAIEGKLKKGSRFSIISVFTPSVRAIIVSLIVVLIPGGGFTTVKAALGSLPGDILYPIKITTEKIQVAFVSDANAKTQLRVDFAERRLQEATVIINKEDNGEREEKVALAVEKFKEEMETITENLDNLEDESLKIVEDKMALLNVEAEKIEKDMEEIGELVLDNTGDEAVVIEDVVVEDSQSTGTNTVMLAPQIAPQAIKRVEPVDNPESFKIQLQIIED
ncbi:MAG: hypothetical protein HQ536_00610 [Parcubacteria group bacterium]|nr:hypothetical protein [Parcubacteria group bacterium]